MTRREEPPGRAYTGPDITVYYDARRCIHFAACVRGLPDVFNTDDRPWIRPERATAEQIMEVVRRCPTGALHYTLASGPTESPDPRATVTPQPYCPLFVRGDVVVQTSAGELRDTRVALCRCGHSANKPFCDGTHLKIGWHSNDAGSRPAARPSDPSA